MSKGKIAIGVALTIILSFIVYQVYAALYNPITTEVVSLYTATDGIDVTGILIREETLVKNTNKGAMHFEINDSQRVSANGIIASIYTSDSQSIAATKIADTELALANIKEIEEYNDLNAVDINSLNAKIFDNLNQIITANNTGFYSGTEHEAEELLNLINRKQIATGEAVDFTSLKASLESELASLKAAAGTPSGYVRAEKSGYFISSTDGYENILRGESLGSITPEFLDNLVPEQSSDTSVIGKLVSDYTWYIAANVSISDSLQFKAGDNLTVNTSLKSNPEIAVTVERINMSEDEDRATIILSCQEMSAELSSMRTGAMTIVRKNYEGLRVSSKALRVIEQQTTAEDGTVQTSSVTGVYTVSGMTAEFTPVQIIYSGDGFVICEEISEDGALRIYDEIIVKGKNIYDGKIID